MMKKLRVAVIGCGRISVMHLVPASMLEEGCRRVLVSTGELRIDDDQLEHSHQYADDGDEEEDLLRAAFEI